MTSFPLKVVSTSHSKKGLFIYHITREFSFPCRENSFFSLRVFAWKAFVGSCIFICHLQGITRKISQMKLAVGNES